MSFIETKNMFFAMVHISNIMVVRLVGDGMVLFDIIHGSVEGAGIKWTIRYVMVWFGRSMIWYEMV